VGTKSRKTKAGGVVGAAQTVTFHPEVRKQLKAAAALAGKSMPTLLHEILCKSLSLPHLADQPPVYRRS
jgi:hypothetical protein